MDHLNPQQRHKKAAIKQEQSDADEKLSPLVRQISWTNNLVIMSRCLRRQRKYWSSERDFDIVNYL